MIKIVIDKNNLIIESGVNIIKDNYNNESVIKITNDNGFYFIRNSETNNYSILEIKSLIENFKPFKYFYINNEFVLNQDYSE